MKPARWFFQVCLVAFCLECDCARLWAEPKLAPVFGDRMVLQQEQEIRLWGNADPNERISVFLLRASATATANNEGQWSVTLPALKAGGPFELRVEGKTTIVLHDVLVGEVWIASGQSNMTFPLRAATGGVAEQQEANDPQLRFFTMPREPTAVAEWLPCTPQVAGSFSAVAYFFARQLRKGLGVPVGIILSAFPGSAIEQWISPEGLTRALGHAVSADDRPAGREGGPAAKIPASGLYHTMIATLFPLSVRGVIWYQGESNVVRAETYQALLGALIGEWRTGFQNQNLQFLIVQLPGYGMHSAQPGESPWAELREAQAQVAAHFAGTGLAVTIDLADGGNLHPPRKQEVGERLGSLALGLAYKRPLTFAGPKYRSAEFKGSEVIVHFEPANAGLEVKGTGVLLGFAVAGRDHKFYWADASIRGDTVVASSRDVPTPVAVRYGWSNDPACNLADKAGYLVAPFRSDNWPGVAHALSPGLQHK